MTCCAVGNKPISYIEKDIKPNEEERAVILKRAEVHSAEKLQRFTECDPERTISIKVNIIAGASAGFFIGAGIGGAAQGIHGACFGSAGGAVIGGFVGAGYYLYRSSNEFAKWKSINEKSMAEFRKVFRAEVFEKFQCVINLEIMEVPTITPCGHTFDFINIKKHLETNKETRDYLLDGKPVHKDKLSAKDPRIPNPEYGNSTCPSCGTVVKVDKLRTDYLVWGKLTMAYREFIAKTPIGEKLDNHKFTCITQLHREGLSKLLIDLEKRGKWCFDIEETKQEELLSAGKITKTEYHKRLWLLSAAIDGHGFSDTEKL